VSTVLLVAVLTAAVIGSALGMRHVYLRLDRPGGLNCSLRVVHGEVPGLGRRFRSGYAGPEMGQLMWRRIAWPDPAVRFPLGAVRVDRDRRPRRDERLGIPASFSIVPVDLADGVVLELAVPRAGRQRIVTLLGQGGPGRPRR
jgi:hypothetical protein